MKEPNLLLKASNFTVAAISHFLKGNPTCTQEEIDQRFTICKSCKLFTGVACAHKRCGCNINDQQIYLNKLAWKDQACPLEKWGIPMEKLITLCITTFKRPEALACLQNSIKYFYPTLPQVVVDTKGNLSWGRNFAIKQVMTPYFMLLEDDFIFIDKTDISILLRILQEDDELAIIGGKLNDVYTAYDMGIFRDTLTLRPAQRFRRNHLGQEYALCDYTANFGLCRKKAFEVVKWDEELEIHEHLNFFYHLKQTHQWRVGVSKDVQIRHVRPRPTSEYKMFRKRNFMKIAQRKLGLICNNPKEEFQWPNSFRANVPYKEELEENVSIVEKDSSSEAPEQESTTSVLNP